MKTANILFFSFVLVISGCVASDRGLVKSGDAYEYIDKTNRLIVTFSEGSENEQNISRTAEMLRFLLEKVPVRKKQDFYIEGLTDDLFYNFHLAGEELFFSQRDDVYQNRMLIYGYLAFLYSQFSYGRHQMAPIPLENFNELFAGQKFERKEYNALIDTAVDFAVKEIFFISILELLERQGRYFYPAKTNEELYRVLIYPEVLSFWQYMESRFGRKFLFKAARKPYSPEEFKNFFAEPISDLEAGYVKKVQASAAKNPLTSRKNLYESYLQLLELYMSGTKKSLMRE